MSGARQAAPLRLLDQNYGPSTATSAAVGAG
eukprot:CAMPEP_0177632724 /NCGR_PEP_ID=MMETSP0447-20121125/2455_1 /TAXON_ID=0 /ORGANISM="Stygamoeba regulata, Strain BSH-02190019" /LENGTH=30 /DNA_ID= /DNA_START= /DNA_END= /DNA_ORIENTATION=